jgi:hypothetical protein
MEQLLNSDGTPSFTSISDLRNNFEESFAKKQLGASMKTIIVKSLNNIDNANAADLLTDEKIRGIVKGSISDISDKCFTNDELNGSSYIGGLKKIVKEYAGMEADYREDLANAILSTEKDRKVASEKIFNLFSIESLKFSAKGLAGRFEDELNSSFAMEAEELVTEIGKEVGAAIAEAEEKNVIINETSKVIQDKQDEIREELSTTDEDEEDDEEESSDEEEEFDDSEDDGEEPSVEDEDNTNDDETSTEDFEYGIEHIGFSSEERKEALELFAKERPRVVKNLKEFFVKLEKKAAEENSKSKNTMYMKYDNADAFAKALDEKFEILYKKFINKKSGNSKGKFTINLMSVKDIDNVKYIISLLLSLCGFVIIPLVLLLTDEDDQNANKIYGETKGKLKDIIKGKLKVKGHIENHHIYDDISLQIKVDLKKMWKAGGLEDYENEVNDIETNLENALNTDIENGNISVVDGDISVNTEEGDTTANNTDDVINVAEHTEDGAVGNENPDQVPDDITETDVDDAPTNETVEPDQSVEGYGTVEYRKAKFGNENLGKVIVPLSPTKLDFIDVPKTLSLATVFAKATESNDSLRSVIGARFDILEDIVSREHDEELTNKFNNYKKFALEALDDAQEIQYNMNAIGITPFGLEDTEDPITYYIGAKAYKYLSHNLKVKNLTPKKEFKSVEDAIDAAFDVVVMKDKARNAKSNEDLIAINKDRAAREDLFWSNIININTDEEKKDQIKNILQFGDLNIDKSALVDNEYLNSLDIALDTLKTPVPGKSEDEIHEELFDKSKERIESFLGKDLDMDQIDIIHALIEGRDTSDFAPTVFEKFIIKLGSDKVVEAGDHNFNVSQEDADLIKNKAIVLTALNSFVDKTNALSEHDTKEFKEYIGL